MDRKLYQINKNQYILKCVVKCLYEQKHFIKMHYVSFPSECVLGKVVHKDIGDNGGEKSNLCSFSLLEFVINQNYS